MAQYEVQDNETGRVVTFEWNGDKDPTDSDMSEVFAAANKPSGATRSYKDETPLSMNRLNEDLVKRGSYIADTLTPERDESFYDTMKKAPLRALKIVGKGAAGLVNDVGMQVAESAYKTFVPESWQKNISEWGKELLDTPPVNPEESLGQSIDYAPGRMVKAGVEGYGAFKKAFPEGAEIAESMGNIAMAAPILKGVGKYAEVVGEAGKEVGKSGYNLVADAVAAATRRTPEAIEQALDEAVTRGIEKGIRPTVVGKGTIGQINAYKERAKTAVKEIVGNKDNLILTDAEGNVIEGSLPKSLKQFSEAIDQTKKEIFAKYDALQTEAGTKGASVDLAPIVKELEDIAASAPLQDLNPSIAKYAQEKAAAFLERGGYTTAEAQDAITQLNKSLQAFYKNPSYENATKAGIDSVIANNLRKSLDGVIENATEGGYQELKNAYGSLKTIEKEVAHRAVVDARKNIKGLLDFTDIYTSAEFITGIATMNPVVMAKAGMLRGIKEFFKLQNNPNRIVKNMFGDAENIINSGKPRARTYGPAGPTEGPPPDLYPERGMGPNDIRSSQPQIGMRDWQNTGSGYVHDPYANRPPTVDAEYVDIPPQPQLPGPQRLLNAPDIPPGPRPGTEPPVAPIVQPGATSGGKQPSRSKGPENAVTFLQRQGGVKWGESYNGREMRQNPDGKRLSNDRTGMPPDEAAELLNDSGLKHPDGQPWDADRLAEMNKTDDLRNVFTPEKSDAIWERRIRREEAKYYADVKSYKDMTPTQGMTFREAQDLFKKYK